MLYFFTWRDARRYGRSSDDFNWFGTWWSVSVIIFAFGLLYKSIFDFNETGYMFFFWAGVVASRVWHLGHPVETASEERTTYPLQLAGKGV